MGIGSRGNNDAMILYKIVKTREDRKLFAEMYQKYLECLSILGHDIVTNPKLPLIDKELEEINLPIFLFAVKLLHYPIIFRLVVLLWKNGRIQFVK